MLTTIKICSFEVGLYFRDGEFKGLLGNGRHWFFDPLDKVKWRSFRCAPVADPREARRDCSLGALKNLAVVLDLKDYQRAWFGSKAD